MDKFSFKSFFKLSMIIKIILIIVVLGVARSGYTAVSQALDQNYRDNNSTINKQLPSLEKEQKSLSTKLTNAKHDQIVTKYHYQNAFNKVDSTDKTLKKWINKKQKVEDKVSDLKTQLTAKTKQVNHLQNAYISKENIHNAHFNLKSIAIVAAVVLIFFIIGF
ncbi:hypothetical protein [Nicoliella lavandulae]|uniref:Uncharacterized protein n=1 Tax=Nicoliella lavandulae TaxID=3082954 RepID=A0ABU8SMP8_9LACO